MSNGKWTVWGTPAGSSNPQSYDIKLVDNGDSPTTYSLSTTGGSGGGSGGAVTIADGANVAQGTTTDAAYSSGAGTVVSILKGIFSRLVLPGSLGQKTGANSLPVVIASDQSSLTVSASVSNFPATQATSVADGSNAAQGATSAAAYTDSTGAAAGTVVGILKGIFTKLAGYLNVATTSDKIAVTPVITASSAYAAGKCIGGTQTITNAVRVSGGTGVIQTVTIIDSSNQKAPLDIVLFNQSVSGTYTDNAALTIAAGDIPNIGTRLSISASDYVTVGGVAIARVVFGSVIKAVGSRNMYFVINNTSSTPTYASTSALIVKFGILQD